MLRLYEYRKSVNELVDFTEKTMGNMIKKINNVKKK